MNTGKVAELYREFFESVAPQVGQLEFANLGWGLADMKALVKALPAFERANSLECAFARASHRSRPRSHTHTLRVSVHAHALRAQSVIKSARRLER